MKTKYNPIAMRCTQQQFDSIKDRINLPIVNVGSFDYYPYLTNSYNGKNAVSNTMTTNNRETIEFFNADYFLDCCGREKPDEEVVFNGGELQYRMDGSNQWRNCYPNTTYRVKPKPKPNLDADIAALQQKAKELGTKITITFD